MKASPNRMSPARSARCRGKHQNSAWRRWGSRPSTSPRWPRLGCRCRRVSCCRRACAASNPRTEGRPPTCARSSRKDTPRGTRERSRLRWQAQAAAVSVRSGAPVSMPGMMETVLDVGLSDDGARASALTGNPRLVWDCYRRLVQSFAEVVHGIAPAEFEAASRRASTMRGSRPRASSISRACAAHARISRCVREETRDKPFPQSPLDQLEAAVDRRLGIVERRQRPSNTGG